MKGEISRRGDIPVAPRVGLCQMGDRNRSEAEIATRRVPGGRACRGNVAPPWVLLGIVSSLSPILHAAPITDPQREFFESRIRPILAQECYECHSEATKAKGGLLLDSREGWMKGGESGPVIVPGDAEASLLLRSIRHEIADLKMPKAGAQLDAQVIEDFRAWIAEGAPDPRDRPPTPEELQGDTDWSAISARRAQWWSFQPIQNPEVPGNGGEGHAIDAFIRERLAAEGLEPAPLAESRTLVRRLAFNLTGLPPGAVNGGTNPMTEDDLAALVDSYLASPAFGEKWARHWMDWTRYADSHGSEGDPAIPHAWQYRDYLIRALNADVPVDQLLVEHLAGDLLDQPRLNAAGTINESALGLGHLRMVFHGFTPTDALEERVRFTDDQINSVTKAFLGLTVSCARCHHHKFDAISQDDYYALYGIFTNALPATIAVDAPGVLERNRDELAALKQEIRSELAEWWRASLTVDVEGWKQRKISDPEGLAAFITELAAASDGAAMDKVWDEARKRLADHRAASQAFAAQAAWRGDLSDPAELSRWSRYGEGSSERPTAAGDFLLSAETDAVVARVLPGGAYSSTLSTRHRGVLASAPLDLEREFDLFVRIAGDQVQARYVVQNYPRTGTIYPQTNLGGGDWGWVKYDLGYWKGDRIHFEVTTAGDAPVNVKEADRSWFGVGEAVLVPKASAAPPAPADGALAVVLDAVPENPDSVAASLAAVSASLEGLVNRWTGSGPISDDEAMAIDQLVQAGWLGNDPKDLPEGLAVMLKRYRELEADIPLPTRAPGVWERPGADQALYVRGNHKQPDHVVPRRFLEAIDAKPYETQGTGRLEFARDLVAEKNPFTARVIVNRVWTHLFGEGLVASVDNFGRLGEAPSHPELLDHLALRFRGELGWSIKALIREIVLSETFRQASGPSPAAQAKDPANRLLSSYPIRRLEAEAIRDALLAISGGLDRTPFGPPVGGDSMRRSIYLRVKRNDLDPFLTTFDFPTPASTVGRRDVTNVPAQSLTLLNNKTMMERAAQWVDQVGTEDGEVETIRAFFRGALYREPDAAEIDAARAFVSRVGEIHARDAARFTEVKTGLEKRRAAVAAMLDPLRARMEAERLAAFQREKGSLPGIQALHPIASWDFEKDAADAVGDLDLSLEGSARIEEGALIVDGKGWAQSPPLPFDLGERSLEAKVRLATLDQAGGGVLSVQSEGGALFDGIVYAERRPREWLSGSNLFDRTLDFNGPADLAAASEVVHLVMTYANDGTIRAFRNGEPYGEAIRKSDAVVYRKGEGEILLGLRHGRAAVANKPLRGSILEARLYDRALTPAEAKAAYLGGPVPVSDDDLRYALSEADRARLSQLESEIVDFESEEAALADAGAGEPAEAHRWTQLAHAIFNLKEFVYLR